MRKLSAIGVLSAMTLAGVVGALFTVFVLIFLGPYLLYVARNPSSQAECGRIHNGMSVNEALAVFDTSSPPYDEGYSTRMIFVSRRFTTCEVQLENGVVVGTSIANNAEITE